MLTVMLTPKTAKNQRKESDVNNVNNKNPMEGKYRNRREKRVKAPAYTRIYAYTRAHVDMLTPGKK